VIERPSTRLSSRFIPEWGDQPLRCLFVTQEYAPFFAEGGLGVTSSALPRALMAGHGIEHDIILPFYPRHVSQSGLETREVCVLAEREIGGVRSGAEIHLLLGHGDPCNIFLLKADRWYDRPGIYCDDEYRAFADEAVRAAFFGSCVADWITTQRRSYDAVHANDWQSGPLLNHLSHLAPGIPKLLTIHNAMYRGLVADGDLGRLGLPEPQLSEFESRHEGKPDLLLAALLAADAAVTCSPTYSRELAAVSQGTPFGKELDRTGLTGIVFGVDAGVWDPSAPGRSTEPFSLETVDAGKLENKSRLRKTMGLQADMDIPLIGVCSRLVPEKGSDILLSALAPMLSEKRVQLVLIGPATDKIAKQIETLRTENPGEISYVPHFRQDEAWLLYAGSDLTVMPSLVEPCGLNQLIAYRYGTLPVVTATGGLRDTVTDVLADSAGGAGFIIPESTTASIRATVDTAVRWMQETPAEVTRVRRRAMALDWTWAATADRYAEILKELDAHRSIRPAGTHSVDRSGTASRRIEI